MEITCFWPKKTLKFSISARKRLPILAKTLFFLEITCFLPEKPLKFSISARKSLPISARTFFFFGDHLFFCRKNRLNFRFWPEKGFGFRRRPYFFLKITCFWLEKPLKFSILARISLPISAKYFGDHLIFTKKSPKSSSRTMKIWVKFVYGTTFQKILGTCLFFTKVQSTLKKHPPHAKFYNLSTGYSNNHYLL